MDVELHANPERAADTHRQTAPPVSLKASQTMAAILASDWDTILHQATHDFYTTYLTLNTGKSYITVEVPMASPSTYHYMVE
jgi:hypothetical protein